MIKSTFFKYSVTIIGILLLADGILTWKAHNLAVERDLEMLEERSILIQANKSNILGINKKIDSLTAFDKKQELLILSLDERLKSVEEITRYLEKQIRALTRKVDDLKNTIPSVHKTAMTQTTPQRFKLGGDFERLGLFEFSPYNFGDIEGDISKQVIRVKNEGERVISVDGNICFSIEKGQTLSAQLFFNGVPAYNASVWQITSQSAQDTYTLHVQDEIKTLGKGEIEVRIKSTSEAMCKIEGSTVRAEVIK